MRMQACKFSFIWVRPSPVLKGKALFWLPLRGNSLSLNFTTKIGGSLQQGGDVLLFSGNFNRGFLIDLLMWTLFHIQNDVFHYGNTVAFSFTQLHLHDRFNLPRAITDIWLALCLENKFLIGRWRMSLLQMLYDLEKWWYIGISLANSKKLLRCTFVKVFTAESIYLVFLSLRKT